MSPSLFLLLSSLSPICLPPFLLSLPILLLSSLPLAPLAQALPASAQFHLSTQTQASSCFIKCHNDFCAFHNLSGNTLNFPAAITLNCGYDQWQRIMPRCLAVTCASAPDVAYAVEYGRHFCARAGVPDVQFEMPERFLLSLGGAWFNESMASPATQVTPAVAAVLAAGTIALLVQ